jgi:hypothetical protein
VQVFRYTLLLDRTLYSIHSSKRGLTFPPREPHQRPTDCSPLVDMNPYSDAGSDTHVGCARWDRDRCQNGICSHVFHISILLVTSTMVSARARTNTPTDKRGNIFTRHFRNAMAPPTWQQCKFLISMKYIYLWQKTLKPVYDATCICTGRQCLSLVFGRVSTIRFQ